MSKYFTLNEKVWLGTWTVNCVLLLLFSFTQTDLNFSLANFPVVGSFLVFFRNLGYYNRPFTTIIYILISFFLFFTYSWTLYAVSKEKLSTRSIKWAIGIIAIFLTPSYPAFSRDVFNNIFVGKLVLYYHQNPHIVIPMHLTGIDPWLSFLHWVHVPSVYGYGMTALSIIFYGLSFGKFIIALLMVKILYSIQYILLAFVIGKILDIYKISQKNLSFSFVLFHPLLLVETLVNVHNDITMMLIALFGIYFFMNKHIFYGLLLIILSATTKYVSVGLFAVAFPRFKPIAFTLVMTCILIVFLVISKRELQPWYALWILPVMSLFNRPKVLKIIFSGIFWSFMFIYAPFFYYGHWNNPVPMYKVFGVILGSIFSFAILAFVVMSYKQDGIKSRTNLI